MNSKMTELPVEIVMVEDDEGHAHLIEKNIRRAGVNNAIRPFTNGTDAVNFLFGPDGSGTTNKGKPLLILLDLNLPDMTGVDILKRVKTNDNLKRVPVVVLTTTTLAGAVDVTFLQEDGGVSLGADPGSMTRILPKGFPDRVSQWEDRGVLHQVLGRACVTLPGVSFGSPEPVEGVWVETVPVHALGPRTRTLYLPGVGEAETLVWKDGQWQAVFRLVSRGFTDLPLARAATNQGVVHE